MNSLKTIFVICLLTIIGGCSSPGSEYIGKWQSLTEKRNVLTISKEGEVFLLRGQIYDKFFGTLDKIKYTAGLKNGILTVESMNGGISFGFVKSTNTLVGQGLMGSEEFKKIE